MPAHARSTLALLLALSAGLLLVSWATGSHADDKPTPHTEEFFSRPWEVRDLYPSMRGPARSRPFVMNADPGELIWMTGARMTVVDLAGEPMDTQDNLCHASIKSHHTRTKWLEKNEDRYGGMRHLPAKWFNIVAGQLDLDLPDGFGIPLYPDEPLEAFTMILNNDPDFEPFDFRVKTQIDYVYQRDLKRPMIALSKTGMDTKVVMDTSSHEGHDHSSHAANSSSDHHDSNTHAEGADSCGLGHDDFLVTKVKPAGSRPVLFPGQGDEKKVMHFMVSPGRHEFRNRQRLRGLPPGAKTVTAHYMTTHLHVYGESVELIDATEGKSLFKSAATPNQDMTAVVALESWSSVEGLTLYADHQYEIVTTYNNTTDHEVDAMGVIYIYFANPYFDVERLASSSAIVNSNP